MYNGMMDPELMRIAQEQFSRMSPEELAKMQQQVMSNPELVKMATESMKNMRPEDFRHAAEQLKHTRAEDMAEIRDKIANAKPEEIAAMKAQADAHISYQLDAAEMLKKQGNEFHCQGKFHDAADKYMRAKNNLTDIPGPKSRTLQLQCSLNLMSCYLKTNQYDNCIKEGSEVLAYDSNNVKALYRRGQAYKELGNLKAAVADLEKAHKASPDDETIADVLRDAEEKLLKSGDSNAHRGVVIEEIEEEEEEEENEPSSSGNQTDASVKYSVTQPVETTESSQKVYGSDPGTSTVDAEYLKSFSNNPEAFRAFQNSISNADPDTLAAMSAGGMSPDMMKTAADMMGKMKPEELQKIFEIGASMNSKIPSSSGNSSGFGSSKFPEITPELAKQASDMMSKMSPEEFQRVLKVASSFNGNGTPFAAPPNVASNQRSESGSQFSAPPRTPTADNPDQGENTYAASSRMGQSSSSFPTSTADLQQNMRNSMNDPAMRQMFTSMMKNMSPEMMANMSEQFGMKLSKEDAAKAQQAMSSLSPEDLDRMMRWAERAQRAVDTTKKAKNWLLGRSGLILAICMLILAFILHQLGFIGG
ncbi:Peptidyl-prolyl cis-trans isomerase Fpr3/Fpr4-like protein [Dioscorea alata]|uniref:Peptidyl-prolyl cis-trans isomerase Fpr3/Fpr4-like protein n=1 Tax=Dioscorea alata TaxID=55571 RepID=A0ACB7UMB6_DIOAL|nr:Peptidyl-prolyl cis-trans isomerase Fpr3/Fpr4-like protein [Dioscorea alata]